MGVSTPPVPLERHVKLASYTTLELGGPAEFLAAAHSERDLLALLGWARGRDLPLLVLGGGSNLVVSDEGFEGLVIQVALKGSRLDARTGRVWSAAGEPWDALVQSTVEGGLAGLECLSGIPGSVGATPIQNVGAYGREVSEFVREVRAVRVGTGEVHALGPTDCAFGYRDSALKRRAGEWVVLSVSFDLDRDQKPRLRYPELRARFQGQSPSIRDVRDAVLRIRRGKSMVLDPEDANYRSVGSFFVNPVVSNQEADRVVQVACSMGSIRQEREVPRYPLDAETAKLSAAWLIEQSGMGKGLRRGRVGVSSRHALALVHYGGGSTRELLDLAREIRNAVAGRFGIWLQAEPTLVGCVL